MLFFKRRAPQKEIQAVYSVLDDAAEKYDCINYPMFETIKGHIIDSIKPCEKELAEQIKQGRSPVEVIYMLIVNISGDLAESGKYHIYRGVLNPVRGADLLLIHDSAIAELVKIGFTSEAQANEQKKGLRECIAYAG